MVCERVQQSNVDALVEQDEEALGGRCERLVTVELLEIHFYGLTGGEVEKAASVGNDEFLSEHDPVSGMETLV